MNRRIAPFCIPFALIALPIAAPVISSDYDSDGYTDDVESGALLADADLSGRVDGFDLAWMGREWGTQSVIPPDQPNPEFVFDLDYTRNGIIDGEDLAVLAAYFSRNSTLPPPTASLTADPVAIAEGQNSTLTWSSSDATSCTGSNFSTGGATSGSVVVSPTVSTTYTLDCSGPGGSAQDVVGVAIIEDVVTPYHHVTPADVGVTIGVGVTGPLPTEEYAGGYRIDTDNTLLENLVFNTCLDIYADNVTIRNVIINCDSLYGIDVQGSNVTVENSKVNCTSSSKTIKMLDPVNGRIVRNEVQGCQDAFFIDGNVEGLLIEDNYIHSLVGNELAHADGMQIGEAAVTYGTMTVRGNYWWKNNDIIGATDILFATDDSQQTVIMENNFFKPWGAYTLRCTDAAYCIARYNVYSLDYLTATNRLYRGPTIDEYYCNRLENGDFVDVNDGDDGACPPFDGGL
jgi:hypothetical protein